MESETHRLRTPRWGHYYSVGSPQAEELWIVLHGYGQQADRFLRHFHDIAGSDRRVVAPEGLSRFYLDEQYEKIGASWMTRADREDEVADQLDWLDAVAQAVDAAWRQLTLLGFSQGAPTAGRWLLHRKVPARRLICWGAGLPHDVDLSEARMVFDDVRLDFVLGDQDEYLTDDRIGRERQRLDSARLRYDWRTYEGGHRLDPGVLRSLA